ncbi:MAG TPA: TetR/AcrR family transcriptional regulator [Solirubrobacterales bacterium]|nr:TetR/AcrR family transcriptional regulator [Solirubrobacterales bacterium]
MEVSSPPRRLPPAERRDQLINCALAIAARDGYENLAFEAVANRAGVTRNLVYHYFPGGRQQLLEALVHRAGEQLSSGWVTDPGVPLGERLAANLNRMMDHAAEPTDAWQLYRQGRGSVDPALLEIARGYRERVIGNIALNQLGTAAPPPLVRIALDGFLAYVETVIESAIEQEISREQVLDLVSGTLMSAMNNAAGAEALVTRR